MLRAAMVLALALALTLALTLTLTQKPNPNPNPNQVLVLVRFLGVCVGSVLGGVAAREERKHYRNGWMSYVTQAGVALGFAQEVKDQYRTTLTLILNLALTLTLTLP